MDGVAEPQVRLAAVRSLTNLKSSHGQPAVEAALHRVLASSATDPQLRETAAEALWSFWHHPNTRELEEMMRLGTAYMEKQHYKQAVEAFSKVTEQHPSFVGGWHQRAMAHLALKQFDLSIQDCQKALELRPLHFGSLATLGMCHRGKGDAGVALRYFNECLAVHPGLGTLRGCANALEKELAKERITKHMWPRIAHFVQCLPEGTPAPCPQAPEWMKCDWDVHYVGNASLAQPNRLEYMFRIRINNGASPAGNLSRQEQESLVRSSARFYMLRFASGDLFPLTRLNNFPRTFELGPGDSYRFSFTLVVASELSDCTGAVLLEQPRSPEQPGLTDCVLPMVKPTEISRDEAERLRLGYPSTGLLDIRRFKLDGKKKAPSPAPGRRLAQVQV